MRISVLGAGAGGTAVAFDCAAHGHDVRLFDFAQFPDNIATIAARGGITPGLELRQDILGLVGVDPPGLDGPVRPRHHVGVEVAVVQGTGVDGHDVPVRFREVGRNSQ